MVQVVSRRSLLQLAGTATIGSVTGCIGSPGGSVDTEHPIQLSVEEVQETPSEIPFEIDLDLRQSTVTDIHPGRIRVTTVNSGSTAADISISSGGCGLFNRSAGASDSPAGLWLRNADEGKQTETRTEQWSYHRDSFELYGCGSKTFAPDESLRNDWTIWDDSEVSGYFSRGIYSWEETVQVFPGNSNLDATPSNEFTWGFSLRVE